MESSSVSTFTSSLGTLGWIPSVPQTCAGLIVVAGCWLFPLGVWWSHSFSSLSLFSSSDAWASWEQLVCRCKIEAKKAQSTTAFSSSFDTKFHSTPNKEWRLSLAHFFMCMHIWKHFVLFFVGVAGLSSSWALASPVFSAALLRDALIWMCVFACKYLTNQAKVMLEN